MHIKVSLTANTIFKFEINGNKRNFCYGMKYTLLQFWQKSLVYLLVNRNGNYLHMSLDSLKISHLIHMYDHLYSNSFSRQTKILRFYRHCVICPYKKTKIKAFL